MWWLKEIISSSGRLGQANPPGHRFVLRFEQDKSTGTTELLADNSHRFLSNEEIFLKEPEFDENLSTVHARGAPRGFAKRLAHACLEPICPGKGHHFVFPVDMERFHTNPEVKALTPELLLKSPVQGLPDCLEAVV